MLSLGILMASRDSNNADHQDDKGSANNVGALLKASRLRLGDDLRFVAETLHIRFIYLEAIEAARYDDLPGKAYAIGFIRSYADYLGLDSQEVVRRYKSESASQSGNPKLVFPVPIPESSIPGGAIVFVGVVVALLAYGGWYVSTAKDGFLAGLVSAVPERLSEDKQVQEPEITPETVEPEKVEQPVEEIQQATDEAPSSDQVQADANEEVSTSVAETIEQAVQEPTQQVSEEVTQATEQAVVKVEETVQEVQETAPAETNAVTETVAETSAVTETVAEKVEEVTTPEPVIEAVTEVQQQATPAEPEAEAPAESSNAESTGGATVEKVEAGVVSEVVDEGEEIPAQSASPAEIASTSSDPEPASSNRIYGAENENSRILVKARRNSWIQVRDNNANQLVMTRLLRAGDSYRVPDQAGLVLLTGNAGALEIFVDGEAVPDLGEAGKVRRNVTLDPDLLRQGSAAQ